MQAARRGGNRGRGNAANAAAGDGDADFIAALTGFQFSAEAIQAIVSNGLTATESLIGLTSKDIENVMTIVRKSVPPIVVNYISQKRLTIMAYWVNRHHRLAESIETLLFTQEEQETYGTMMNSEPDRETTVKEPPEFKGSVKWKPWKEGVISYFNSVLTKDFIPLTYIIREQELPDPFATYDNEHQRLVAIAPLRGNEFKHDNGIVFDFLKSWSRLSVDETV